jgi:hypothetical protein
MRRARFCGLVLVTVAACAPAVKHVWMKPVGSQDEFARDRYTCLQEAKVPYSRSYINAYGGGSRQDTRLDGTRFDSCMEARGWRLVEQPQ